MTFFLAWLAAAVLVGPVGSVHAADTAAEQKPDAAVIERNRELRVAKAWVRLEDEGHYARSWAEASDYLRSQIPQEIWLKGMESGRSPAGVVVTRQLTSVRYQTKFPGAPDGEFMVVQFGTSFETRPDVREIVTPMRDPDGKWRVAAYLVG
ncbi:MAG: hypothetical protein CMD83_12665 [Gammaproteobacteria bacterium]|nr:hypothetical protein [Gammaproteobacteria bacterium]|tara:strand:- start:660 stop:1112 length:453 start_codon:yes stop_codon:yes gene_type:complete